MKSTKQHQSFRRRCSRYLDPLVTKSYADILIFLETAHIRRLRALQHLMKEVSNTNCSWMAYDFAYRFKSKVDDCIESWKYSRKTKKEVPNEPVAF